MCTQMGTKNISLTDDAYARLQAHKRSDESFSDVVLRLTGEQRSLRDGIGQFPGLAADVERGREEFAAELEARGGLR